MKLFYCTLLVITSWLFISCNYFNNPHQTQHDFLKKVEIKCFADSKYILKKDTVIKEEKLLNRIQKEVDNLKEQQNPNVKSNYGFYELHLSYHSGAQRTLGIVYTVYDGVIISEVGSSRKYKNNTLELLIVDLLSR